MTPVLPAAGMRTQRDGSSDVAARLGRDGSSTPGSFAESVVTRLDQGPGWTPDGVRPRIEVDVLRPRTQGDVVRPRTQGDVVRPSTEGGVLRPRTEGDVLRPRTEVDVVRLRTEVDVARQRTGAVRLTRARE